MLEALCPAAGPGGMLPQKTLAYSFCDTAHVLAPGVSERAVLTGWRQVVDSPFSFFRNLLAADLGSRAPTCAGSSLLQLHDPEGLASTCPYPGSQPAASSYSAVLLLQRFCRGDCSIENIGRVPPLQGAHDVAGGASTSPRGVPKATYRIHSGCDSLPASIKMWLSFRFSLPPVQAAEGAAGGASAVPRDVQRAIDGHRRAGGVQHLVQLLDEISVGTLPSQFFLEQNQAVRQNMGVSNMATPENARVI